MHSKLVSAVCAGCQRFDCFTEVGRVRSIDLNSAAAPRGGVQVALRVQRNGPSYGTQTLKKGVLPNKQYEITSVDTLFRLSKSFF